ncbi:MULTISPECIES: bifunctional 2',3'-cyclic-nucleotide 2'-phosphodiesterase/3'-nucleotidase [Pacificibacter]|uniref:bifunctional 2',3'-cyclic-nucleotide 2'-phosphodiesterase/3'-nucleotidase n=1 Tax=Pacificibacter TaxID=1042323 RepID=UPI001C0A3FC4|nr:MULTISPECIES: bifunctional 2',3'-cyclic-nucleotide 2'-phosphodiesterase/3'-nucleotidase [Pacificibacter]MBU2937806.1 bifunctional 2',3'-cyclic-nucleotide 2'-phosphodiesterase/3'-nucleotidase [Pacificibacter marinus]MDO6616067.1 bifunctional 2',3'-cyclic-nucleotide 2'-phosphodiesterase/3'-nucleotidase [Pacificibacter sp. 1_MG-2023]
MIALHPFSARASVDQAHLRIMETTDLHVHVFPYDYYADRPSDSVGLARTAAHINAIRAEANNAILVDNGDLLQGNPMGDYIAYERGMQDGDMHPIITAMNTLGYDAATLGNHEFNYGIDFLLKSLQGADFPVVSANVIKKMGSTARKDITLVKPYVILDRYVIDGSGQKHPIKVGLIGFVPPQIMTWDRRHLEGNVVVRDIVDTARAYIPEMKEKGADLIIALNHSGIGSAKHVEGMENASVPLAELDGIDAMVTGHSHLVFPSPDFDGLAGVDAKNGLVHGKPTVMGGFWGSHLGLIDLMIERSGNAWRVITSSVETRPIAARGTDRKIASLVDSHQNVLHSVAAVHDETLQYIRRAVGKTATSLHSYFALVADDPSVQIVANAQLWYLKDMFKGTEHDGLPILSAAAPFKAGGRAGPEHYTDVAPGNLAIKNIADLYFYPNTIRAVRITGAELKGWLDRSAGMFLQIKAGRKDQLLLNPEFPPYNFDVIDGVTYKIDLTQPSRFTAKGELLNANATRIVDLAYQGKPVTDDMEFIVATNNYRAGGGGAFPGADGTTIIFEGPDTNRDIIVRYIVEQGTVDPKADNNWTFAPLPDTSVIFETGPKARDHLTDLTSIQVTPAGDGANGFSRFRIAL